MDYIFDFQLHIDGFSPAVFRLTYLDCQNDGLSQDYVFHLKCFSNTAFDLSQWGLKKAVIYFHNKPFRYGVLISGKAYEKDFEGYFYEFCLSSPLALFKTTGPNRVFVDKTVNQIIDEVFSTAWHASQWRWDLHKTLPKLDYRVQYHQADYDFVMGLFSEYQLNFIFDGEVLKISDNLNAKNITHHVESPQPYYSRELAEFLGYDFEPALNADLFTAKIEAINPEEIDINHEGYYRIRFPFDTQSKMAEGSKPVPLLSPHFMHFPLKADTEVAVRFLDGNINQPVLVGVIPEKNPEAEKYIHHSYAGHVLEFIPEKIALTHASLSNYIQLAENTVILCDKGNIAWRAENTIELQTKNNFNQIIKHDLAILVKQEQTIKTGELIFKAKENISCSAENAINIKANDIEISALQSQWIAKDIIIQGNFSIMTINGAGANLMLNAPVLRVNAKVITGSLDMQTM